jgi:hypothetical protein
VIDVEAHRRFLTRVRADPERYEQYKQKRREWNAKSKRRIPRRLPPADNVIGIKVSSSWLIGTGKGGWVRRLKR